MKRDRKNIDHGLKAAGKIVVWACLCVSVFQHPGPLRAHTVTSYIIEAGDPVGRTPHRETRARGQKMDRSPAPPCRSARCPRAANKWKHSLWPLLQPIREESKGGIKKGFSVGPRVFRQNLKRSSELELLFIPGFHVAEPPVPSMAQNLSVPTALPLAPLSQSKYCYELQV